MVKKWQEVLKIILFSVIGLIVLAVLIISILIVLTSVKLLVLTMVGLLFAAGICGCIEVIGYCVTKCIESYRDIMGI